MKSRTIKNNVFFTVQYRSSELQETADNKYNVRKSRFHLNTKLGKFRQEIKNSNK